MSRLVLLGPRAKKERPKQSAALGKRSLRKKQRFVSAPACASSEVHVRHSVNGQLVTEPIARRARAVGRRQKTSPKDPAATLALAAGGRPFADRAHLECVACAARPSDVGVRFGARPRDRPFGHYGARRYRRSDRVHGLMRSTPQAASLHNDPMIDRTPLLRFLSPSALACHVALMPGAATRIGDPASTVDRLSHATSFALMPPRHHVTHTMAASGLSLRFCAVS